MQNYQQEVFNFISSVIGQKNIIPVPVEFVHFAGDANTAMLLTQVFYWSDRTKNPDGWFYKSYEEWFEEIALNKYFCRKAISKLKEMNVIETAVKRIGNGDTCLHFKLNKEIFIQLFGEHLQKRSNEKIKQNEIGYRALQTSQNSSCEFREVQTLNFPEVQTLNFQPLYTETTNTNYDNGKKQSLSLSFLKDSVNESTAGVPAVPIDSSNPVSDSVFKEIVSLLPSTHSKPLLEGYIRSKINSGVSAEIIKAAVLYTNDHSNGNTKQYRSYLGKTLDNGWAVGYLEMLEAERIELEKIELKKRKSLEELEQLKQKRELEIKARDDKQRQEVREIRQLLDSVDLNQLDRFIESQWDNLQKWERENFKEGKRYLLRKEHVRNYIKLHCRQNE